ncbi:MAG: hypothetical protein AMK72_07985 [Planctomycetes bacterium SM23_25]|nr:MAG: hypothetical protein AMK72_07985 [Planctomycetes bacterium SM23_25]
MPRDHTARVHDERVRDALHPVRAARRAAAPHRVDHAHLLGEGLDLGLGLGGQAADDDALRRVLLVHLDQVRDARATGRTPGGPELDDDDAAAKVRERQRRRVQPGRRRDLRRLGADAQFAGRLDGQAGDQHPDGKRSDSGGLHDRSPIV